MRALLRPDPATRFGGAVIELGARLVGAVLALLRRTCRYEVVAGGEHLAAVLAAGRPIVLALWHDRSVLAAPWVTNRVHGRGLQITVLASKSRDGELVARLAARLGFDCVRGSASRGGREAVRALYRSMTRRGTSAVIIPDGPRGPKGELKVGVAVLAQLAGAPILPLGFAARRAVRLRSWDRLVVPLPGTRVAVVVGAPETLPRTTSSEELEGERTRLESVLQAVTARAEAAVG